MLVAPDDSATESVRRAFRRHAVVNVAARITAGLVWRPEVLRSQGPLWQAGEAVEGVDQTGDLEWEGKIDGLALGCDTVIEPAPSTSTHLEPRRGGRTVAENADTFEIENGPGWTQDFIYAKFTANYENINETLVGIVTQRSELRHDASWFTQPIHINVC